jgi:excisionase family DNA binding protein
LFSVDLNGLVDELERRLAARVRDELSRSQPAGYLNVKSAAAFLDTSQAAVRAMVKRGELPVHRTPNGRILFSQSALVRYVEGQAA